jgi:hypothetical protein
LVPSITLYKILFLAQKENHIVIEIDSQVLVYLGFR